MPYSSLEIDDGSTDHLVRLSWGKLLLAALALVLVFEAGGRIVASQSTFNDDLLPRLLTEHRINAASRETAGIDTEILFFGSSNAGADFDPKMVPDQKAYDLWWAGAGTDTIAAFGEAFGTPLFDPETVVIGVTSRELNDSRFSDNAAVFSDVERSLAWRRVARRDALTRVELATSRVSVLVRHRSYLRRPTSWVAWMFNDVEAEGLTTDETGRLTRYRDRPEPLITPEDIARESEALADYEVGGPQTQGLRRVLDAFEGRRVVLVFLPVSNEDYAPLHPNGMADIDAARAVAEETANEAGAEFLDLSELGDDRTLFGDANHMNQKGSEILTQMVLEYLGVG